MLTIATPEQAEARRWVYYGGPVYGVPAYGVPVYAAPAPVIIYGGPVVAYRPRPVLAPRRVRVAPVPLQITTPYAMPPLPRRVRYYSY